MFLQPLDLTTALRPSLLPDEALLLVQDSVGLYEGFVIHHSGSHSPTLIVIFLANTRFQISKMGMPILQVIEPAMWTIRNRGSIRLPWS